MQTQVFLLANLLGNYAIIGSEHYALFPMERRTIKYFNDDLW